MCGTKAKRLGFTLLELLVVLLILGILGSVIVPNLTQRTPRYEREQFIAGLNALMQSGLSQTVSTHTLHQIHVDMTKREISLRKQTDEQTKGGEPVFKPISGAYARVMQEIPEQLVFKQFSIEGINEMKSGRGGTKELWFFLVPEGLTQHVTINMIDTEDTLDGKPRPVGLVLNPFTAQFKVYDVFQK